MIFISVDDIDLFNEHCICNLLRSPKALDFAQKKVSQQRIVRGTVRVQ